MLQSQLKRAISKRCTLYIPAKEASGNHYHKDTLEYFTVVSGKAIAALKDLATGARHKLELSADDNKVIKVAPGVVHAFKNEDDQPLIILAISTREYNKFNPDTFTFTIL